MSSGNESSGVHAETLAVAPGAVLSQMAIGHYVSRALYVAAKLGLADLLGDGPRHGRDLAAATGTHAPSLERVVRLLASVGVFEARADGTFALAPLGESLRADAPGSLRALVLLLAGIGVQDCWKELEYCVRTGEPAFRRTVPGADPYTLTASDELEAALFDSAIATFATQTAAAVAAAFDFSEFGKVADIGGGSGRFLLGILNAYPKLTGIVFDRSQVAERAKQEVAAAGLTRRCRVVGGSFFDEVPRGADAYLLKDVLIDWSDDRAIEILRNCRAAMPSHGKILIIEGIYPARIDQSAESRSAAATDVLMLVCTGGRQRSEAQFRDLLAKSGFRLSRVVPTPARACVMQGGQV